MLEETPRRHAEPKASRPQMPGYGILGPKQGKGLLPWRWANDRLRKARTFWLGTTRPDGRPHVMPLWGVWLDNGFYFSTGTKSRKARNLAKNPRCTVAAEIHGRLVKKGSAIDDALIVEGVVERVEGDAPRRRFAAVYEKKYDWDMSDFEEPIYLLRPSVVFGFSSKFAETATRWVFGSRRERAPRAGGGGSSRRGSGVAS